MRRKNIRSNNHRMASIDPEELNEKYWGETTEHDRLRLLLRSLEPGEHIAAKRRNGMYEHHGIYEGTNCGYPSVIHFQGPITSYVKGAAASLFCIYKCGYRHPKKGGLVISCLDCFSQGKKMFKIRYMMERDLLTDQDPNWNYLKPGKVIAGYCTKKYYLELFMDGELYGHSRLPKGKLHLYRLEDQVRFYEMSSERSSREVLGVARESKLKSYNLGCNNCEHFAVFCKTGLRRSIQVEKLPIPIICEDGKRVCCRKRKGLSGVQTEQENSNQEGKGTTDQCKKSKLKNKEKKNKSSWSYVTWKIQWNKTK